MTIAEKILAGLGGGDKHAHRRATRGRGSYRHGGPILSYLKRSN
jgi:hypothetical protein